MHTTQSGVAHYMADNDGHCLEMIRARFANLPEPPAKAKSTQPAKSADDLYGVLPADHRLPYEIREVLDRLFDANAFQEFQPRLRS